MRRNVVRFALTGFVGAWVAGCSADATRFADGGPFSNPFASASNTAAPTPQVAATPLASAAPANPGAVAAAPPSAAPVAVAAAPVGGSAVGWTAVGGSPIIVAQGDDLDGLSRRYGVPTAALLTANGLHGSSDVRVGMRLVVPVYHADAKVAATEPRAARKREEVADAETRHKKSGDVAEKESRHKKSAEVAEADSPKLKKGEKADKKKSKKDAEDAKASDDDAKAKLKKKKQSEADAAPAPAKPSAAAVAEAEMTVKAGTKKPDMSANGAVTANAAASTARADAAGASPEFRWPARGRIIQGFKSGGNDGINIAVPEGTSVRAAEDGKVAYAGSALKGYGNLVLIRHPNGFVTAYANNAELDVKNGDTVKRGQVIAKSGQSGDVSSPQLHFELRKGSTPVDPTSYLAGL